MTTEADMFNEDEPQEPLDPVEETTRIQRELERDKEELRKSAPPLKD